MRRGKSNEFSGRDDLGLLPESREMLLIAGDQIVRAGSIGTFKEHIVVGVACDIQPAGRNDGKAVVFYEPQQLQSRWLDSRGNQDICIDYETERKHYRFASGTGKS